MTFSRTRPFGPCARCRRCFLGHIFFAIEGKLRCRGSEFLPCRRPREQIEAEQLHQWRQSRQQSRLFEPDTEAGVETMVGMEFPHCHHALPLGDRHQDRAPATVAEFTERLRGLVFLVRRKITRAQHETCASLHRSQHPIELTFQSATLGRPIAQEHACLVIETVALADLHVDGWQIIREFEPLDR